MINRLYNAIRLSLMCRKAGKLTNENRLEEAMDILHQINGPDYLNAELVLIRANLLTKMKRDSEAIALYDEFLSNQIQFIKKETDRDYLQAYAIFLRDHAALRIGEVSAVSISKETVNVLRKSASPVIRGDFTLSSS